MNKRSLMYDTIRYIFRFAIGAFSVCYCLSLCFAGVVFTLNSHHQSETGTGTGLWI